VSLPVLPTSSDWATFAPVGLPRARTKRDLLALALIGDDDLEPAVAFWRQHAPPAYAGLLDDDGWSFDEVRQQYVSDTGTRLRPDDQKRLAILFALATELELESEAKQMAAGVITIGEWEDRTASLMKRSFTAIGALGVGGIGRMTDADRLTVTGKAEEPAPGMKDGEPGTGLEDAVVRLDRFARQVERHDETAHTLEQVVARAGSYANGSHTVYEEARRSSHGRARHPDGSLVYLLERNRLDDKAMHCASEVFTAGCPELTELGWVPIGSLPPPGTRTCRGQCRCSLEFADEDDVNESK
jgi:hypothetical protein